MIQAASFFLNPSPTLFQAPSALGVKSESNPSRAILFGKNPGAKKERLTEMPPVLQIEENVLKPKELQALLDYFDANFDPNHVLPRGVLTETLYSATLPNSYNISPGKAPIEFLKPPHIFTNIMDRLKEALQKGFNTVHQGSFKYSLLRYRLPLAQIMPAVPWHADGAQFLGILTLRQPETEGGQFEVRPLLSPRKQANAPVTSVRPASNKMIVFQDRSNQHRVTEWQAKQPNNSHYPDKAFRDVLTVQLF